MKYIATVLCITGFLPGMTMAGTGNEFEISPDITINLGTSIPADEDVVASGMLVDLGALPGNAALTAFHRLENGDRLFVLDTTVMLPGNQLSRPGDVIRFDGANYSLEFDGLANGVPAGAGIDALSMDDSGKLILSFDVTTLLDGHVIADEDLAKFDGAEFSLFFDASANGISGAVDLDAVHFEPLSQLLVMSFDSGGSVSGTTYADEDLMLFDPTAGQWTLAFDGSASNAAWIPADLDATFAVLISDVIFYGGFEELITR